MFQRVCLAMTALAALSVCSARARATDIIFCLDISGSISAADVQIEVNGVFGCISDPQLIPQDGAVRVGVIVFSTNEDVILPLTPITPGNLAVIQAALNTAPTHPLRGGATDIQDALDAARNILNSAGSPNEDDIIFLISDGVDNEPGDQVASCTGAAAEDIRICAIGVSPTTGGRTYLQNCAAATGGSYGEAPNVAGVEAVCRACLADVIIYICADANCTSGSATCFDLSGDPTAICTPPGPYPLGSTQVVITIPNGEFPESFTRLVVVRDCTPPTLIGCPNPSTVTIECGDPIPALPTVTATDNCDEDVTVTVISGIRRDPNCPNNYDEFYTWTATDDAGNSASCSYLLQVRDTQAPEISFGPLNYPAAFDDRCEADLDLTARISDCGIDCTNGVLGILTVGGGTIVGLITFDVTPDGDDCVVRFIGTIRPNPGQCSASVRFDVSAIDRCGNFDSSSTTFTISDTTPPVISCPRDITVDRGDYICNPELLDWLNSATATDNCDADVTITNDAPACGFPEGTTTTVTWTADDGCGNISTCSANVTVSNAPTGVIDQKGSLLQFSKVELRWRQIGGEWRLIQDTFIELSNDYPAPVSVQLYFINGDPSLAPAGGERGHPGCNNADNIIHLTQNEPTWWSSATGLPKGVVPFHALDGGNPPGRPDPDGSADRVLRGYLLAWAVDNFDREIRWNHLSGKATVLNYADASAWEYAPWAFQIRCGDHGAQPLDCIEYDANGVCCAAEVIPGRLDMDGFQYDNAPAVLLGQFFASNPPQGNPPGPSGLSRRNEAGVIIAPVELDTELVLHPASADLRQETNGPVATKAKFNIWNENEVQFSNTEYCISCWDQRLLSRVTAIPNHFLRSNLQTDAGKYRVDGVSHPPCLAINAAILGVQATHLTFQGGSKSSAGGNLVGQSDASGREENASILYDVLSPGGEARTDRGLTPKVEALRPADGSTVTDQPAADSIRKP
ncbi:MAG: VWA domain-containing protein [Phycisphaerales bacterium]|nr:VWA domain-containing protein [Phycisphaerales bacterium]